MGKYKGSAKYVRSPQVVSRALAISESICALATDTQVHISFTSRTSKRNYVEAHHLVPFSQQASFSISLDVEENITALCPNCHRMLHHGIGTEKMKALKSLFRTRGAALQARGIDITFEQLKKMYGELSEDD